MINNKIYSYLFVIHIQWYTWKVLEKCLLLFLTIHTNLEWFFMHEWVSMPGILILFICFSPNAHKSISNLKFSLVLLKCTFKLHFFFIQICNQIGEIQLKRMAILLFGSRLWCLLWVCHFPIGILGQVWYLIVSIPDLCNLTYLAPYQQPCFLVTIRIKYDLKRVPTMFGDKL